MGGIFVCYDKCMGIKNKKINKIVFCFGLMISNLLICSNAFAETPSYYAREGASSIVVPDGPDMMTIIKNLLNTTFGVVGVIAVVMMIIGGFYYLTSQGSPERVQKGKNTILYGIVGLIIVLSAFAIVNFVLSSLLG